MVGWSLRILGRNQEAENTLQEALAIAKDANTRDIVLSLHYDLSLVYEQLGQPNKALFHRVNTFAATRDGLHQSHPSRRRRQPRLLDVEMHEALLEDTGVKEA
jgi:tetratricopeptide (TPR) repeat protein